MGVVVMFFKEIILAPDFTRWKSKLQIIKQNDKITKIENPGTAYDITFSFSRNIYRKKSPAKISIDVDVMDYVENVFIKFEFKRISKNYYEGSNSLYKNMENVSFRFLKKTKKYLTVVFCINKDLTITEVLEEIVYYEDEF